MRAGIIAAGEGSRLRSEGVITPKPLVKIGGKSLIERLLLSIHHCGIERAVCIVNEASTEVVQFVATLNLPLPVEFIVKSTPSSMHSLFELAPRLTGEMFLLTTVDSVFDEAELKGFILKAGGREDVDGVLAVTEFVDDENPLYVETDERDTVRGFSKSTPTRWVTGGLYIFSPRIFREIPAVKQLGIERLRNFLGHLVTSGYRLEIFRFSKIVDVDRIHDIRIAEAMLGGR